MSNHTHDTAKLPYSGYYQRTIPAEDAELTHTGPGTPAGEYMRRFWQPVALSADLRDLPCTIRVLGEDLVTFRDLSGRVGVLHRHCSHRGTSLEFGQLTDRGIRCCYHGWHFDIDGTVLDTPGEPANSRLKTTLCHGAYPAFEMHGLVFAYMGPPHTKPEFPIYDTYDTRDNEILAFSNFYPCNWLQVQENIADPMHACFLHSITPGPATLQPKFAVHPELEFLETDGGHGMLWIGSRRIDDEVWVRSDHFLFPNFVQIPALFDPPRAPTLFQRVAMTRWVVPIDNENCWIYGWRHFNSRVDPTNKGDRTRVGRDDSDFLAGQTGNRSYEEKQREPGDWDALVSQRPIAVHALEHLGATDIGVAMYRRLLRKAIRANAGDRLQPRIPNAGGPIPTYTQDTVLRIPRRADADDKKLLRRVGRRILDVIFEADALRGDERDRFITSKLQRIPLELDHGPAS